MFLCCIFLDVVLYDDDQANGQVYSIYCFRYMTSVYNCDITNSTSSNDNIAGLKCNRGIKDRY